MGLLDKLIPDGIDFKEIEKRAAEAEQRAITSNKVQDDILAELRKISGQLAILQHAAEVWMTKNS